MPIEGLKPDMERLHEEKERADFWMNDRDIEFHKRVAAEQQIAALLKMHASLAEDRKAAIDALSAQEEQIATLKGAAEFDKAIFQGALKMKQDAVTRALAVEAKVAAQEEQIAALKQEVWRLQSKLSEVFDYDARDSAK